MSAPQPLSDVLLAPVEEAITTALSDLRLDGHEARLEVLEAVSCSLAGLGLDEYRLLGGVTEMAPTPKLERAARKVVSAVKHSQIPAALALASLAREPLPQSTRRNAGCCYTDFRLAMFLARRAAKLRPLRPGDLVIDPASGTGILLAAAGLVSFGGDRKALDSFVRHSACAVDLSPLALRGVRVTLSSLVSDIGAVNTLGSRLLARDSLGAGAQSWHEFAPNGFDLVIGNPPWEKLEISRHEHLTALGALRHYGDDYDAHHALSDLDAARCQLRDYVQSLEYELQGKGEPDLYKLFLALSSALVARRGQIAMLVPAGLIRSEGTRDLRRYLITDAAALRIAILDNKARFFSIDTRFKFLAPNALVDAKAKRAPLIVEHAQGSDSDVKVAGTARIGRRELVRIRPDYSLPEVRSGAEWSLFRRLSNRGTTLGDPAGPRKLHFAREIDMTNDRELFQRQPSPGAMPLIEGRMVHQFRHNAKAYVSGTGRRADWDWLLPGDSLLRPQFWLDPDSLPDSIRSRTRCRRLGFCDITGQTNERSMLAASIPPGVVCGNKVPTVVFRDPEYDQTVMAGVWLAVANSFVFDWLLRRVITTTVNYFLLLSVPFPCLDLNGIAARRLAKLASRVERQSEDENTDPSSGTLGSMRAELDAQVMDAYGVTPEEAELVLEDFPLLDRGQPVAQAEPRSTITRDLVLLKFKELRGVDDLKLVRRVEAAQAVGAEPYTPSQLARVKMATTSLRAA